MAIFLITAPSGAGKTTLVKEIQRMRVWQECISHTTRKMREGEVEGETYYYVTEEEFTGMSNRNELAERVIYNGNKYGISKDEIKRVTSLGKHVAVIVEYDGYTQMKQAFPDAVGIFIHMSKEDCMANMLLRGDSIENALGRIELYDEEVKNREEYDYVIKNVRDKFFSTSRILRNIAMQYEDGGDEDL